MNYTSSSGTRPTSLPNGKRHVVPARLCALRFAKLRIGLVACVLSLGGLFTAPVAAQWQVIDEASIAQDGKNFVETVAHYAKEIAQFEAVLDHYAQQLISLAGMKFTQPVMNTTLVEVPLTQGMDETCPNNTGVTGIANELLQLVAPDFNKPIVASQLQICQQIVMRRNHQYNLTVNMLNRLQGTYSQYLQQYENLAALVGNSQGALAGSQSAIIRGSANLETEMKNWQAQIQTDEQIINYLQSQQAMLGKMAMRGKNTVLGNVVQAATLKLAFDQLNDGQ